MSNELISNVKAVIFDVGNTLTTPDWERIIQDPSSLPGSAADHSELQRMLTAILRQADGNPEFLKSMSDNTVGTNWHFRRLFAELGMDKQQQERLAADLDRLHMEKHLWTRLNDNAVEVLSELKRRGYKLGAISNSEDGRVKDALAATDLLPLLDVCLDSFVVGFTKPDPQIFRLALEKLKVSASEAAFIGDSYTQDFVGAGNAGLQPIFYDPSGSRPDVPSIRSLSELL